MNSWLARLLGKEPHLHVVTIRDREVALQFPTQTPLEVAGRRRSKDARCEHCRKPLQEVLLTTGGPAGDASLWREHPLAVDGWTCKRCGSFLLPRAIEPEEGTKLLEEGAAHGKQGRWDEAELAFRRVANSWPKFAPARVNLAMVYHHRVRTETYGDARPLVLGRLLGIMVSQLQDALRGQDLPDLPRVVHLLADALLAREAEGAALDVVDAALDRPDAKEADRAELARLREWVQRRGDLYERGTDAIRPLIRIQSEAPPRIDAAARRRIEQGIDDLLRHHRINPASWSALWVAGKGRQALDDVPGAAELLGQSFRQKPDQPDVAREYCLALIQLERFDEAADVARSACAAAPEDAGLVSNLALVELLQGKLSDAEQTATRSVQLDSADPINRALLGFIREVMAGQRPRPRSLAEMEGRAPPAR